MDWKTPFFDHVRATIYRGKIPQQAVEGFSFLLDMYYKKGWNQEITLHEMAYVLATVYHETAHTMQPIREFGRGKGKKYGTTYYGRGYVQLTWKANYEKAQTIIGAPFVSNPDLALNHEHAAFILFHGMSEGWFTGKKLSDYKSFKSMRKIINGMDKATLIAGYAEEFHTALKAAEEGKDVVVDLPETSNQTETVEDLRKTSRIARGSWFMKWIMTLVGGGISVQELTNAKVVADTARGFFGSVFTEWGEVIQYLGPALILLVVVGWWISHRIERARLEDHTSGKTR